MHFVSQRFPGECPSTLLVFISSFPSLLLFLPHLPWQQVLNTKLLKMFSPCVSLFVVWSLQVKWLLISSAHWEGERTTELDFNSLQDWYNPRPHFSPPPPAPVVVVSYSTLRLFFWLFDHPQCLLLWACWLWFLCLLNRLALTKVMHWVLRI